jgi:hypothetical protein
MTMTGGCLCGAVRYEVSAAPIYGALCYCEDCRRLTSSHSSLTFVPKKALQVTGALSEFSRTSDAGNVVTRYFCPTCGAGIYSEGTMRGVAILKAGTLDDASSFHPEAAVFTSRAPHWDKPAEGLKHFPGAPTKA